LGAFLSQKRLLIWLIVPVITLVRAFGGEVSKIKIHVKRQEVGVIKEIANLGLNILKSECSHSCQDYYGQVKESLHIFGGAIRAVWQMLNASMRLAPICFYFLV
jgi:hypothetical protein